MTVADCLQEYQTLGKLVFGKPRFFTQLRFKVGKRPKFRESNLKKVFQEVTNRRCEKREFHDGVVTFHMKDWEGLCQT